MRRSAFSDIRGSSPRASDSALIQKWCLLVDNRIAHETERISLEFHLGVNVIFPNEMPWVFGDTSLGDLFNCLVERFDHPEPMVSRGRNRMRSIIIFAQTPQMQFSLNYRFLLHPVSGISGPIHNKRPFMAYVYGEQRIQGRKSSLLFHSNTF